MDDEDARADPALVAAWVSGWARSRGVGAPSPAFGGWRVQVGLPDQTARYVFAEASTGVATASRAILDPLVFIKVCAAPDRVRALLGQGWTIQSVSSMMSTNRLGDAEAALPAGYRLDHSVEADGHVATIVAQDGETAARGRMVLVGGTAVFDRIETTAAHRRRGLGRALINALGRLARRHGAQTGALVATPDGRALYTSLGWRLHALYTTAARD